MSEAKMSDAKQTRTPDDPFETWATTSGKVPGQEEQVDAPRQINLRAVGLLGALAVGAFVIAIVSQSSSRQARTKTGKITPGDITRDVGPDLHAASDSSRKMKARLANKKREREEEEAQARRAAQQAPPPHDPPSQLAPATLEPAQLEDPRTTSNKPAKPSPWALAREQHEQRVAQRHYEQRFAARTARLFFASGAPRVQAQATKQNEGVNADTARELAQIQQARQQALARQRVVALDGQVAVTATSGGAGARADNALAGQRAFFGSPQTLPGAPRAGMTSQGMGGEAVMPGTLINVVLETGVDSSLPGVVVGRVARPVFDRSMRRVLIDAGARVLGRYNPRTAPGQARVQVSWTQLITTQGALVELGGMPGVDLGGMSGWGGEVDRHVGDLFTGSALAATLGASNAALAGPTNALNVTPRQAALSGGSKPVLDVGEGLVRQAIERPPTIRVAPGALVGLLVTAPIRLTSAVRGGP